MLTLLFILIQINNDGYREEWAAFFPKVAKAVHWLMKNGKKLKGRFLLPNVTRFTELEAIKEFMEKEEADFEQNQVYADSYHDGTTFVFENGEDADIFHNELRAKFKISVNELVLFIMVL